MHKASTIKPGDLVIMPTGNLGLVIECSEPIFDGYDSIADVLESKTNKRISYTASCLKKCNT